jgi:hypothetical protein
MARRHVVVDVQVVMIGAGLSSPPDDGSCLSLLKTIRENGDSALVWDSEGLIRNQYETSLKPQTFGRDWLQEVMLRNKVVEVDRCKLDRAARRRILDTGLVGEDLKYYVRTAASSPDRRLVSHDSDYDAGTRRAVNECLDVQILSATDGQAFLDSTE